ncbi:hypothetical protein A5N72_08840 [Prescottella equi]|nr:hypothetical protein A5N72_08840 [Prescottella equi]
MKVQPVQMADWICGQFDAGKTKDQITQGVLDRLREQYAAAAKSKYTGWEDMHAGVLVVDAARYYCPENASKIPA